MNIRNLPESIYDYRVGGKLDPASFDIFAKAKVRQYRLGDQVKVYYNPDNAAQSVLERRAYEKWVVWALIVVFAGERFGWSGLLKCRQTRST